MNTADTATLNGIDLTASPHTTATGTAGINVQWGQYGNIVSYPEPPKRKMPGDHCTTYAEFREYVKESPDVPEWVKTITDLLENADPFMAEIWADVIAEKTTRCEHTKYTSLKPA